MRLLGTLLLALIPGAALAQEWNDSSTMARVARAVARRGQAEGDSALRSWTVRAHGVLLFLAEPTDGRRGGARLVTADELDVEVYWSAPGVSKQVIRGWRQRRALPTDNVYHRDHLGIVTDGFGPKIRIGEGEEVRDVPHPLSSEGVGLYQFRLRDSAQIVAAEGKVVLDLLEVRPVEPAGPGVVGTLSLDRATGALVRAAFSFTPTSYRDAAVEELTVVLDYALVESRWWLPWRQMVEIRRRNRGIALPYEGVIRGNWEFGEYQLDVTIPPAALTGPAIGGLLVAGDSAAPWPATWDSVLAAAAPAATDAEVAAARDEIAQIVSARAGVRAGGPTAAIGGVSDLVRFDRVQGVAIGVRTDLPLAGDRLELSIRAGAGLADERITGGATFRWRGAGTQPATVELYADERVRDFSDLPVTSGLINSIAAQEWGNDNGDYVLLSSVGLRTRIPIGDWRGELGLGWTRPEGVVVEATPARGRFRPNPDLAGESEWAGRVGISRGGWGEDEVELQFEAGFGAPSWRRSTLRFQQTFVERIRFRGYVGAGTGGLPAWRSFAVGGRGTLLGEGFRTWGGRQVAWGSIEFRSAIPFPAIPIGEFANTGSNATIAPFVAAGWAGGEVTGLPWRPTEGGVASAGVALGLFYELVRVEGGVSLRTGRRELTIDVGRVWWDLL
jgi:hypothetical protein